MGKVSCKITKLPHLIIQPHEIVNLPCTIKKSFCKKLSLLRDIADLQKLEIFTSSDGECTLGTLSSHLFREPLGSQL